MQLGSDSSITPSDLLGLTRFLTSTQDNVNAFTDTEIKALLNLEYRELQAYILSKVMNDWNENTLEGTGNGLITLVDGTESYAFPSDMLTIDRMEINYTGGTNNWVLVDIRRMEGIKKAISNNDNDNEIVGTKEHPIAWLRDGYIYLDPIPNANVTGGLKVYCTILITDLSNSTDEPVFASPFHEILAYGAAISFLIANDKNRANSLLGLKENKKQKMVEFYSKRQSNKLPRIRAKTRKFK